MSAPEVPRDVLAGYVLDPLRTARSMVIDAGKVCNGVMNLYEKLGDAHGAGQVAEALQDLANVVTILNRRIEKFGAEER